MTDLPSPETTARRTTDDQVLPAITYALYLLGLATGGLTSVVGLIIAYAQRDRGGAMSRSHYEFLIRTFWLSIVLTVLLAVIGAVLVLVGLPLSLVLVGIPILAAGWASWVVLLPLVVVWYAVRCVVGVIFLARNEAYPRPRTWLV
jgi:uncharacterized membrane protein